MPNQKLIPSLTRSRLLVAFAVVGIVLAVAVRWMLFYGESVVTIGVEGRHQVTMPGGPIKAVPYTHGDPLAVRIASAAAVEGGIRYDIRYMAYGPGEHNLNEYLIDERGRQPSELPDMTVSVDALLPSDYSGILFETESTAINLHSNHRLVMTLLWGSWLLLIIPLSLYGRAPREVIVAATPRPSVPERLRQLLEKAEHQSLSVEQQADLEKLLLSFWAERLGVSSARLIDTLEQLRQDPSAGPQLASVERWLHARKAPVNGSVARELLTELGWHRGASSQGVTRR